jgi:hypothetical protein
VLPDPTSVMAEDCAMQQRGHGAGGADAAVSVSPAVVLWYMIVVT